MRNTVYLQSVACYDQPLVDAAVEAIFSDAAIGQKVGPDTRVALKLNLLMKAAPDEAVTTHPAVVRAVIAALQKRGVRDILLCDCPSGPFSESRLEGIYKACGIAALAGDGVRLNYDMTCRVTPGVGATRDYNLLQCATDADVLIGLGKVKTHAMAGMTGAVKNWFGMIPGLEKAQVHMRFPDKADFGGMLCDLYDTVAPDFNLLDGIVGMEGDGPSGGRPRAFGFLAAGENGYYVDRAVCRCLGMQPEQALSVWASIERGKAPLDAGAVVIEGDRVPFDAPLTDLLLPRSADVGLTGNLPKLLQPVGKWAFTRLAPRPVIRAKDCVGCGRCREICPRQTIRIEDKKAVIDRANCIRCFCCHEVCPQRAIDIRTSPVFRLLK